MAVGIIVRAAIKCFREKAYSSFTLAIIQVAPVGSHDFAGACRRTCVNVHQKRQFTPREFCKLVASIALLARQAVPVEHTTVSSIIGTMNFFAVVTVATITAAVAHR